MSRRGTTYEEREYYEERERRAPPAPVRTRERDYEEIDIYSRREREPDRRPDFLREDYARNNDAGPMVLRERETETYTRPLERRPRSPSPVRIRERVVERDYSPPQSEGTRTRTRVDIRERRMSSPPPPDRLRARVIETRERVRERSPSPVRIVRERVIERARSLTPPAVDRVRIRNFERENVRVPTPSPSPSPSPPPSIRAPPIHQEIITHHRHIDHGFEISRERARVPTPPPPPRRSEPRVKETDIDIYTSRNNTEVDITRKETRGEAPRREPRRDNFYDDSFLYEQERDKLRVSSREVDIRRSSSARPERQMERSMNIRDEEEADYYSRKIDERAYIGEAYHGATKDWAIVDVPPGTERVQMDGIGGGSQEITWQKYNGVRRSKFIPERERERDRVEFREEIREERAPRERDTIEREHIDIHTDSRNRHTDLEIEISRKDRHGSSPHGHGPHVYEREYERVEEVSDRRVGMPRNPPKQRMGDLWTEITKDLVVKEAIEQMGYDFEETDFFYYIIQYLRYEDVLQLVELSETIRRERQHRIHEIERERERIERREEWERRERRRERDSGYTDERIIEREVIYDNAPPRRRY